MIQVKCCMNDDISNNMLANYSGHELIYRLKVCFSGQYLNYRLACFSDVSVIQMLGIQLPQATLI